MIDKYYPEDNELKRLLLKHSCQVRDMALAVAARHPELKLDKELLRDGALLHDIGIFMTHAPSIHCVGTLPYLVHGYCGGQILRKEGYPALARVCERHTGAGLTCAAIISQQIPLPHEDFLPETEEEQVVCYADKFYSKSKPEREKTPEEACQSLAKFGEDGVERFKRWYAAFK